MRLTKDVVVGLVFFLGIGLLVYLTMAIPLLSPAGGKTLKAHFPQADGLSRGDVVWVDGYRMGKVQGIELDPKGGVVAVLHLWEPITLREGYSIRIQASAILGGKVVSLERGDPKGKEISPMPAVLEGQSAPEVMESLKNLVESNKEKVSRILGNMENITSKLNAGQGTLGKLLVESKMHDDISGVAKNLNVILGDVREGKGTMGRLYKDDALARKAEGLLDQANDIAKGLREGKGTLGKLLQDEELHKTATEALKSAKSAAEKLDTSFGDISALAKDLREGKGTLGRLLRESEIYENLKQTAENVRSATNDLKEGKGTLGRLLKDDKLYEEARRVVSRLRETLEDLREQVPVSSFTGVLFSAF